MKKFRNIIFILLLVGGALIGSIVFFYVYKDHRDIGTEEANFSITVEELHKQFQSNDSLANATYGDKTIVVSGTVTTIDKGNNAITLNEKLFLTFYATDGFDAQPNQLVQIKGRFVGYDDLMEELKMDQCVLIK